MKKSLRAVLICLLAVTLVFALCGFDDPATPEEMYELGKKYADGDGVEQDYALAMDWYLKAAEAGSAEAMNNVGTMYYNGWGVSVDKKVAREWFEKAAEAGSKKAKENLAVLY